MSFHVSPDPTPPLAPASGIAAPAWTRALAAGVQLACTAFLLIALALQFLRPDLDWMRTPLSFYLVGPYGPLLQGAYGLLSLGLVGLGMSAYRSGAAHARSAAPLLLFVIAGTALIVTALAETPFPGRALTLRGLVHGLAAQTAFLCVTVAMLLQAWRWRADPGFRHRFAAAFGLAAICFLALWVHVLARELPRGASQKAVIVLIGLWLLRVSGWVRRDRRT
nr:DUF998 domain-containing protein [Pseudoxanthomonas sp.]